MPGGEKPVQSSEDDIGEAEDDGNGDDVKYRKGADEVAINKAKEPDIPRQKVTLSATIGIYCTLRKIFLFCLINRFKSSVQFIQTAQIVHVVLKL